MDIQLVRFADIDFPYEGYQISNAFTQDECDMIIKFAEKIGFLAQNVNKFGETFRDETKRTDKNIGVNDPFLQFLVSTRVKKLLEHLQTIHYVGGSLKERYYLYDFLRMSRYDPGDVCSPHLDTQINVENAKSRYTLMLYLNDSDGTTRFFNASTMKHLDIKPEMGKIVVFDQRVSHAAFAPSSAKYTLRTDILEKNVPTVAPRQVDKSIEYAQA